MWWVEIIGGLGCGLEKSRAWRRTGQGLSSEAMDAAQQGGRLGRRLGSLDGGQAPPGPAGGLGASTSVSSPQGSSFPPDSSAGLPHLTRLLVSLLP